jgi:hypothetical protein
MHWLQRDWLQKPQDRRESTKVPRAVNCSGRDTQTPESFRSFERALYAEKIRLQLLVIVFLRPQIE